jgi:hypothetical protein
MGPVFFDMDNRGQRDLWVTDSKYNRLLRNKGNLEFEDVTQQAGISQYTAQYASWGTGIYDYDNDGFKDLLIVHGGLIHQVPQEHSVFRNLGKGKFGCSPPAPDLSSIPKRSAAAPALRTTIATAAWMRS